MAVNQDFWRGRRVLVTGHTGFKGAWLALWLEALGAKVHGLALAEALAMTVAWYRAHEGGRDMRQHSLAEIGRYLK